jgi:hypothetical protein
MKPFAGRFIVGDRSSPASIEKLVLMLVIRVSFLIANRYYPSGVRKVMATCSGFPQNRRDNVLNFMHFIWTAINAAKN